ncbi:MAG: hypothetical protein ACK4NF_04445, partial [Planctomycetota bacterium]
IPEALQSITTINLDMYQCIFDSPDLEVKCLFPQEHIIWEILKETKTTLLNIENILTKIHHRNLMEFSSTLKGFCNNENNIKCYELVRLFRYPSSASQPLKFFCKNNSMELEQLTIFCPAPLKSCQEKGHVIRAQYCYIENVEPQSQTRMYTIDKGDPVDCAQQECPCKSNEHCENIHYTITNYFWDKCCNTSELLERRKITIGQVCEYFKTIIRGCCNIFRITEDAPVGDWLKEFKSNMSYCEQEFDRGEMDEVLRERDRGLNRSFGAEYSELLKDRIKKLKELWQAKDLCY